MVGCAMSSRSGTRRERKQNQWYAAEDFPSAGRADTDTFGQLGVAKEARRLGVGRLLVAAAEERATAATERAQDLEARVLELEDETRALRRCLEAGFSTA